MHDEGYIKFSAHWAKAPPLPPHQVNELIEYRQLMYQHQLIGAYPDGIGFGNISQRFKDNQFIISGSASGNFTQLNASHFSLVTQFDIAQNQVFCKGPIIASSESMSHAVIFQECPEVNAVIHIHHLAWWQKYVNQLPSTKEDASYGTPEMAHEIIRLLSESSVRKKEKVFVMAGHREGLIAFGSSLPAAAKTILQLKQ